MNNKATNQKNWYAFIDGIRGFALFNMLLFHFYYDVFMIFGQDVSWYQNPLVHIWQQFICISFIFISGISWHFSRNNIRRGIKMNLYGLLITAVTVVVMPSQAVWFGILNGIGCCTLLLYPLQKYVLSRFSEHRQKLPEDDRPDHASSIQNAASQALPPGTAALLLAICLVLFLLFRNVARGYLGIGSIVLLQLPDWLYAFPPMTILGFPYAGFVSSDYFPLLPWFFLFLSGYFFWALAQHQERLLSVFRLRLPLFSRLGKNTLWVYLLHQPLLYAAAYLLTQIFHISFR